MSDKLNRTKLIHQQQNNGHILTEYVTLKNVISSAKDSEVGTIHHNSKAVIPISVVLEEMRRNQGPTAMQIDNKNEGTFLTRKWKVKIQGFLYEIPFDD